MKLLLILLVLLPTRGLLVAASLMGTLSTNENVLVASNLNTSIVLFRNSITEANYAFLGFHATNEISQMAPTNAIAVYTMSLSRLRNYHLGDDFSGLLEPWSQVIVPVVASTNVRSSLTFRFNAARTVVSDVKFGQRKLIRELMSTYRSISPVRVQANDQPFVVEIPVFDIWLVGYVDAQSRLVFLATIDLPLGPMTIYRGEPITEAAMLRLATLALRYDGLPN